MINYVIGIGAIIIVILLFRNLIKKGKGEDSGCSCGCNGCSSANSEKFNLPKKDEETHPFLISLDLYKDILGINKSILRNSISEDIN